jgi:hypothetical protein
MFLLNGTPPAEREKIAAAKKRMAQIAADADKALAILHANGEPGAYVVGEIVSGEKGVILC